MISAGHYQRIRAPTENGGKLLLPPWDELPDLVRNNRQHLQASSLTIFDQPLPELARQARREFLDLATPACDTNSALEDAPLVLTGHQPELFHPGVWLKNFVAASLARAVEGVAGNLVIDSDLCRSTSIALPAGTARDPHQQRLLFDVLAAEQPFEERRIVDRDVWDSFGQRVAAMISPFVSQPLIEKLWSRIRDISRQSDSIAEIFSHARQELEASWDVCILECRQSTFCQASSFRRFALHLWNNASAFRTAHNASLADYRRTHRLRSPAQPMPDLSSDGPWVETPFWIWHRDAPQRRGLFVRCEGNSLVLGDLHKFEAQVPRGVDSVEECLTILEQLEAAGTKIRTRALATTFFTRLLIADLFIHGIGGAKYDQVTNSISDRFLGVALPHYATVTGTLQLPIDAPLPAVSIDGDLRARLREIRFHPEKLRQEMSKMTEEEQFAEIEHIAQTKQLWIDTPKTPENAADRHRQITRANQQLSEYLQDYRRTIELALAESQKTKQQSRILFSREYSYCLFPEKDLREFLVADPPLSH